MVALRGQADYRRSEAPYRRSAATLKEVGLLLVKSSLATDNRSKTTLRGVRGY